MDKSWYQWDDRALILGIRVHPRARRDEIAGPQGKQLKIRLTAPPVDGKANQQLVKFPARVCGVIKSQVELVSGVSGRNKRIRIHQPLRLPEGVEPPEM